VFVGLGNTAANRLLAWSLSRDLARHVAVRLSVGVVSRGVLGRLDAVLRRCRCRLLVDLSPESVAGEGAETLVRAPVVLHVVSRVPPAFDVRADLSDGESSRDGDIALSTRADGVILIPDPFYFNSFRNESCRRLAADNPVPWLHRSDVLLWRGSSTGQGINCSPAMDPGDPALRPRVRLCLMLRGAPGVDAKIVGAAQSPDPAAEEAQMRAAGIFADRVPSEQWLLRKFALDIDGNTNAWTNLFTRLLMRCCVLKIESRHGYRQWYYDRLQAWRHYVPVRPDTSDLLEKLERCRSNPAAAAEIAAGQALAMELTWEREVARAIERVGRAHGCSGGPGSVVQNGGGSRARNPLLKHT
jgi:hypothetical protein